jgi:hypothetical protein
LKLRQGLRERQVFPFMNVVNHDALGNYTLDSPGRLSC